MNFGKYASAYAITSRFGKLVLPAALAAAVFQSGCMESSQGGAQGESQSPPTSMRVTSSNPNCKLETQLIILDEDAIRNAAHCGCSLAHNGEKNGDQNWATDEDDDKYNGSNEEDSRDRREDGAGDRRRGQGNHRSWNDIPAKAGSNCRNGRDNQPDRVTICHIPPGNHNNGHTITVGASAVKAHLAHGDKLNACVAPFPACVANGSARGGDAKSQGYEVAGCDKSAIGKRSTLKFFADNIGREILLPSGSVGDEGWFAPSIVRIAWKSAGPEVGDGLRNYVAAGPGLGSADSKGNLETLLDNVPELVPLRALGLDRLEGTSICGIVLDGEVKMSYNPLSGNIQGPNLGKVAFQVLGTETSSSRSGTQLPNVRVRILDADAVCSDPLSTYANAPKPKSMCEPFDVLHPVCSVQKTLLEDTWDRFDSTLWRGDGDQFIQDGYFMARAGASSAAADYIVPCPVPVESTSAVRFTNRLKLTSTDQANYAQSGALFFINSDNDNSYNNYVFINVGYTMAPGKVFVELFGSNNGIEFDQFEETSLAFTPSQSFNVDLWVQPNSYQVAVGEQIIDTVRLNNPVTGVGLFEVGVQQNEGGLRGSVDMTTIAKICQKEKETIQRCRPHSIHRNLRKERMGRNCLSRNGYIRLAKERIKHCARPTQAMRVLCKLKENPE